MKAEPGDAYYGARLGDPARAPRDPPAPLGVGLTGGAWVKRVGHWHEVSGKVAIGVRRNPEAGASNA